MVVAPEPFDSPDAAALREELERELLDRYGEDREPGAKPTAADTALFLVARDDQGRAVGCGALWLGEGDEGGPAAAGAAEIKRMFVRPEARGRGVARLVLERLEEEARARGLRLLRLETGSRQPEARALYESAGYVEIPCSGAYATMPESRCYERRL